MFLWRFMRCSATGRSTASRRCSAARRSRPNSASPSSTPDTRPNRYDDGNLSRDAPTLQQFFDKAAFLNPTIDQQLQREFRFGTAGENILRGPCAVNFEFSLLKSFPLAFLGDRGEMPFHAEAFNLLNTPQFDNPNLRVGIPVCGSITALRNNIREWQFGLKVLF